MHKVTIPLKNFSPIDDRIMGGVSQSFVRFGPNGELIFSGSVSEQYGGGFCSIRSGAFNVGASDCTTICAEVYGDGHAYALRLFSESELSALAYEYRWTSLKDSWQSVCCKFSDLVPRWRGRTMVDAPPLDKCSLSGLGFLISEKQWGNFSLVVRQVWCE